MKTARWFERLKAFFTAPAFSDDSEKTYRAQLLNVLLNATLAIIPVILIGNVAARDSSPSITLTMILSFLLALGLRLLMLKGHIRATSVLWVAFSSAIVIFNAVALGTVRATNTSIFLIIIAAAGMLLAPGVMIAIIAIASLAVLGVISAESAHLLPPADNSVSVAQWINFTALFASMGLLINRSWQIIQEALKREQNINAISRELSNSTLELPALFERILKLNARLIGADAGAISLIAREGKTLEFLQGFNLPKNFSIAPLPKEQGVAWDIIQTGKAVRLTHYAAHPGALAEWIQDGVVSFMGVPIVAEARAIGVIGLFSKNPARRFDRRDQSLAENIGQQAGLAIEKARLFNETHEALEREQKNKRDIQHDQQHTQH
jgi:K+-sensing histidine kinase KdpD